MNRTASAALYAVLVYAFLCSCHSAFSQIPSGGQSHSSANLRLAEVRRNDAPVWDKRGSSRHALYRLKQGQEIGIVAENEGYYAIRMQDGTTGYLLNTDAKLLGREARTTPSSTPVSDATGRKIAQTAMTYLGVPYLPGGHDSRGVDAGGLIQAVLKPYGVSLPASLRSQLSRGISEPTGDRSRWQVGDRLYFRRSAASLSGGIYVGHDCFLSVSDSGRKAVAVESLAEPVWAESLVAVRRDR